MFKRWDATGPGTVRYRSDLDTNLDAVVSDVVQVTAGDHDDWIAARFVGVAHEISHTFGVGGTGADRAEERRHYTFDDRGNYTGYWPD